MSEDRMIKQVDWEKVVGGLECHVKGDCAECPYREGWHTCNPTPESGLFADALALLKAQEPVEPKIVDTAISMLYHSGIFKNYYCGNCGEFLAVVNRRDVFCPQCGRKVKWE